MRNFWRHFGQILTKIVKYRSIYENAANLEAIAAINRRPGRIWASLREREKRDERQKPDHVCQCVINTVSSPLDYILSR